MSQTDQKGADHGADVSLEHDYLHWFEAVYRSTVCKPYEPCHSIQIIDGVVRVTLKCSSLHHILVFGMIEFITITSQFNGPPGSGHGGYVAGAFADLVDGPAEVTLRSPPPLDRTMTVSHEGESARVYDGGTLVGEVRPSELSLDIPDCPKPDAVAGAEIRFNEFKKDDFHNCFACGAGREEGDGLRLLTGPVEGSDVVAAHWTPHANFASEDGLILPRILWSALDCPGVWSIIRDSGIIMLLGRLTARVDPDLAVGTRCTVIGWPIERAGRKALAGTALYDDTGKIRGVAKAVWIDIGKRV